MTALLLRLAAPLQSWGTASRFTRRATDQEPSKSAVIGLLAAAEGRRRTDSVEHLLSLTFAIRTEQAGRLERDFQTAARNGAVVSVSTRHYLADAVFLAAVDGDPALLDGLVQALRRPHFPLYLGRRSCPPAGPLVQGLRDGTAVEALRAEPWCASPWEQRRRRAESHVRLDLAADATAGDADTVEVHDQPVAHGFDPTHRQWEWRSVRRSSVEVANPCFAGVPGRRHEPMEAI